VRILCLIFGFIAASSTLAAKAPSPELKPFSTGWLFHSGNNEDARFPETVDDDWLELSFPHQPSTRRSGPHWYRKHFVLPASQQNKRVTIRLEGATEEISIWLNGHYLDTPRKHAGSIEVDLSARLKFDPKWENVLAVKVNRPEARPHRAWLQITDPVQVTAEGINITASPKKN